MTGNQYTSKKHTTLVVFYFAPIQGRKKRKNEDGREKEKVIRDVITKYIDI